MKRYFITGTDTDCGKTFVTCQWLQTYKHYHRKALAIKPVASGCFGKDGKMVNADVLALQHYNQSNHTEICGWRFIPPIAPHIAAEQMDVHLSAQSIASFCDEKNFPQIEHLLIEGAGGLMVPLNRHETWLDFLLLSRIPVVLVVGIRLGCINHALLTQQVLQSYAIPFVGWVANCLDPNMLVSSETINTLIDKMQVPLLGEMPFHDMRNGVEADRVWCYDFMSNSIDL